MRRPFTMQEERKRILDMVENGTITAQEALALLEELGKQTASVTPFVAEEKEFKKSHNTNTDFVEDLKRDLDRKSVV